MLSFHPVYTIGADHPPQQMQQTRVTVMSEDLGRLGNDLDKIDKAEQNCNDANVDENDYTVFTFQDLQFEFDLVRQALAKKNLFIENQVRDFPGVLPLTGYVVVSIWT